MKGEYYTICICCYTPVKVSVTIAMMRDVGGDWGAVIQKKLKFMFFFMKSSCII